MRHATVLLALLLFSCGGDTEAFVLDFPSQESFVRSSSAEVFVVPTDDFDACAGLVATVIASDGLAGERSTGEQNVCAFRNGGVSVVDAPEGANAFVAVTRDASGQALLAGCTMRNVYLDDVELHIVLAPTEGYRSTSPSTCTVETKCNNSCR